jgi:hypothetical protein
MLNNPNIPKIQNLNKMYEETFVNNKRIIHEKKNKNPANKPKGKISPFLSAKVVATSTMFLAYKQLAH